MPRLDAVARTAGAQARKDLRAAAIIATDRASKDAQRGMQDRIRGVGLGKLANAVGQTSLKKQGGGPTDNPYGVLYARGGDDSLAGGALEAYSRGAVITANQGQWLAIATSAVPKFVTVGGRRRRTTPATFLTSIGRGPVTGGLPAFGGLVFKPIGPGRAVLVFPVASVNIKTGRARGPLKRASKLSVLGKDVVAFVLIRITRRAQRFDKDTVVIQYARRLPDYIADALDEIRARRA